MFKDIFKKGLLSSVLACLIFLFPSSGLAAEYTIHNLELEKEGNTLVSQVILERQAFNAIILDAEQELEGLMVNYSSGEEANWEEVELHDDGFGANTMLLTAPTHVVQFKLTNPGVLETLKLKVTIFYYDEASIGGPEPELQASSASSTRNFDVISRREWGADEELRIWNPDRYTGSSSGPSVNPCAEIEEKYGSEFSLTAVKEYTTDGQPLTWPLQYAKKIEKFAVHHTDSEIRDINGDARTDTRDYSAMVRAIYQYHTISRGWGDIGYNYIIDPLGNIYEGRYGGDKVIGAHSMCFNHGTLGIAIIGNYEDNEVPEPARQALIHLIGKKGKEYKIDPKGVTTFRGKRLSNVFGHKDVRATSCPGKNLYSSLGFIRDRASLAMRSFSESTLSIDSFDYNAELLSDLSTVNIGPGQRKKVTLKFKNTGTKAWDDTTWLHVALNNDPNARVVPVVSGKSFVAADLKESSVAPGKTGSFEVEIEGGFRAGHYAFALSPVVNGRFKISRASEYISFKVEGADYSYVVEGHEFPKGTVFQGQHIEASLRLKNTGNVTWRNYGKNAITLGASSPKDRASIFVKDNPYRIGYLLESEVAPGEIGNFTLNLSIPDDREGEVIEQFTPVIENVEWLADKALGFKVFIKKPTHLARSVKVERLGYMLPGERRYVTVEMENRGDLPWDATTVQTTLLGRGMKVFKRMLLPEKEVKPGQKMVVGFWVEAPLEPGQHSVYLRSRFNNKPIRGAVARFIVEVPEPVLRGGKMSQSESFVEVKPHAIKTLEVKFKNTGNVVWKKKGLNAVHLGTSQPLDRKSDFYIEGSWLSEQRVAELEEEEVLPGEIGTFKFNIKSFKKGRKAEDFQLVMERVGWITGSNVRFMIDVTESAAESSATKPVAVKTPSLQETLSASVIDAPIKPSIPTTTDEKPFRVRLSHSATVATLTASTPFLVLNGNDQVLFNYSAGKEISIRKVGNSFEVKGGIITKTASVVRLMPKEAGAITQIVTMERRPTWNTSLNDNEFRGAIELRLVDGEVAYINELPLEDYILGLAEVSNSAPSEKQKVIAVLARSYASYYMQDENRKFPGKPYDGNDDPAVFQRYLGYGVEKRSPNFSAAAKATSGMVVTYNGKLVKTPYFSQSDGNTRSAQEVWGWTHTPFLKAVSDPWCKGLEQKGHGVGLSGCGATAQAEAGKTFEEIIKYYYTGVSVKKN